MKTVRHFGRQFKCKVFNHQWGPSVPVMINPPRWIFKRACTRAGCGISGLRDCFDDGTQKYTVDYVAFQETTGAGVTDKESGMGVLTSTQQ